MWLTVFVLKVLRVLPCLFSSFKFVENVLCPQYLSTRCSKVFGVPAHTMSSAKPF